MSMDDAERKTAEVENVARTTLKHCKAMNMEAEWITLVGLMILFYSVYRNKPGADKTPLEFGNCCIEAMGIVANNMSRDVMDYYSSCVQLEKDLH